METIENKRPVYDSHGDKHFNGGGTTWKGEKFEVNSKLESIIIEKLKRPMIQSVSEEKKQGAKKPFTFYYVGDANTDKQMKCHIPKDNNAFTVQLEYDDEKNQIIYHGYPDNYTKTGLGKKKSELTIKLG